jgi:hypothetical protein
MTPCIGARSPSDAARPAAICRNCARRLAWVSAATWHEGTPIEPEAGFRVTAASRISWRMTCPNKVNLSVPQRTDGG